MSRLKGQVGAWKLEWISAPRGPEGSGTVITRSTSGEEKRIELSWRVDQEGLWIETSEKVFGFDFEGTKNDMGLRVFRMRPRGGSLEWEGVHFERASDSKASGAKSGRRRGAMIRAQMPGKVTHLRVKEGDAVKKDQPLLVLEAMKMENEIRSSLDGIVKKISVTVGSAIESGAMLIEIGEA